MRAKEKENPGKKEVADNLSPVIGRRKGRKGIAQKITACRRATHQKKNANKNTDQRGTSRKTRGGSLKSGKAGGKDRDAIKKRAWHTRNLNERTGEKADKWRRKQYTSN